MNRRFVVLDGAYNVARAVEEVTFYFDVAPVPILFFVFDHRAHIARLSVRTHPEVHYFRSRKFNRVDVHNNAPSGIDVFALKADPKVRVVFVGIVDRFKQIVRQRQVIVKALKVARYKRHYLLVRLYDFCAPTVRPAYMFGVRISRLKQRPTNRIERPQSLTKKVAIFIRAITAQFFRKVARFVGVDYFRQFGYFLHFVIIFVSRPGDYFSDARPRYFDIHSFFLSKVREKR